MNWDRHIIFEGDFQTPARKCEFKANKEYKTLMLKEKCKRSAYKLTIYIY